MTPRSNFSLFLTLALLSAPLSAQDSYDIAALDAPQLEISVQNYRAELQGRQGVYDAETVELNRALGEALSRLGRHAEASAAYAEALNGLRIASGPDELAQLEVLDSYIDSALNEKDWKQVDRNFYTAMTVLDSTTSVDDPRYAYWVQRFASWKVEAHRNRLRVNPDRRDIEEAVDYYDRLLAALDGEQPDYQESRIRYTREKALVHYYAAISISAMPFDDFESRGTETISMPHCFTINENGRPVSVCESRQVPNPEYFHSRQEAKRAALERHVGAIRGSLRELIADLESDPNVDPLRLAGVVLDLGDLNFLLQDTLRARSHYSRAHEILLAGGVDEEARGELMDRPREISRRLLGKPAMRLGPGDMPPSGLVSFEVSEEGTIRNLGITGSGADLEQANQQRIIERLRLSVYRPRLEAGEPVAARLDGVAAAQL